MPIAFGLDWNGGSKHDHVRAGDGHKIVGTLTSDPRNDCAVVKAQREFGCHFYGAALAAHDSNKVAGFARCRLLKAQGHEIDEGRRAVARFEFRFQDQGIATIATRHPRIGGCGSDDPMAVVGRAEQGRKDRAGIEARPTQPIDRTVATDESGGLAVADQGVVFNALCHASRRARGRPDLNPADPNVAV